MRQLQMGAVEERFAQIIWAHEPVTTSQLVIHAQEELHWKKTTTYTVLKRLCEKGLFQNEHGTVTSLLSQADYDTHRSQQFIEDSFGGSLPAFLAAFCAGKELSSQEVAALREMIERHREV